jgi:hypothetical protein
VQFRAPKQFLVDRERVTPANLEDLHSGTACKTSRVAADGESNQSPVGTIAAGQNLTCNGDTGEGAGGKNKLAIEPQ